MSNLIRRAPLLLAGASLLAACTANPPLAGPAVRPADEYGPPVVPAEPVALPALVDQVAIPHSTFVLDNGLTVIVHEDHKAPVVAVSTWYNVGSKDEPKGKTGFAHLFEHIMFNGSDNLPGDYFEYLQQVGATDYNGTTWFDRTNYFQTVPTGGLERALFMESDRMGYLLGAVTQAKLDNQIGVVQNEKRQGDNRPGGLVDYEVLANLFPEGHPYHHDTIGSMADLDAASLADIKQWFIDKYGPNNATLVLAGDITPAQARPLVEKYFGGIKRGPVNVPKAADVPTLAVAKSIVMKDRVAATEIQRHWAVPGLLDPANADLDLGAAILGGLDSSRFDRILVRGEKIAVSASASYQPFQRIGMIEVKATAKPGVDPALVAKRLDEVIADYLANGPTEDEVRRAATSALASKVKGLEQVGGFDGKATALAEGKVFADNSDYYKQLMERYAAATPASVHAAMRQWLARPAFGVLLEPGDRPPYVEAKGVKKAKTDIRTPPVKRVEPPITPTAALDFPDVSHVTLSNGIKVAYAQRTAVPVTQMALSFDAGFAADAPSRRGLQSLTIGLLDEGAGSRDAQAIAEEQERLGADISASGSADRSTVTLSALSANIGPSLDLLADVVERPTFADAEIERVRAQTLTAIAQAQKEPNSMAGRALPALLYGPNHPYATTGQGDPAVVKTVTRADIAAFHDSWLRPDNLEIFVVSSLPLAELQPLLEARFGTWATPAGAKGVKQFSAPTARPAAQKIYLIDRPGSPQSIIYGGQITPLDPRSDVVPVTSANDVLGGNFLSRINMDLRETKGWSYGVRGSVALNQQAVPYLVNAPVQADRTGDSIIALNQQIKAALTTKGITDEERVRTISSLAGALPGRFETSDAVLAAMMTNALYGRPDNYYETLAGRYRALTNASMNQALRGTVAPDGFVWVVVGDAAKVRPQLAKTGIPVEVIPAR